MALLRLQRLAGAQPAAGGGRSHRGLREGCGASALALSLFSEATAATNSEFVKCHKRRALSVLGSAE